ncbi:hypothetical protein KKE47_02430, partial [Patescibacteria group bacterium]|nr:hypothetical protein [Patescibacteria group bacterium]MBU4390797.1 hypothetical protein [Patescibacteria group bacterium]MBU4578643.1 hypothetical protein [Patescibacteria group bacterium]
SIRTTSPTLRRSALTNCDSDLSRMSPEIRFIESSGSYPANYPAKATRLYQKIHSGIHPSLKTAIFSLKL